MEDVAVVGCRKKGLPADRIRLIELPRRNQLPRALERLGYRGLTRQVSDVLTHTSPNRLRRTPTARGSHSGIWTGAAALT